MKKLDLYDKKILYELDINSKISFSKIGEKIKLPKETVNYRVKKLIKNKYINSLYPIINSSIFGYQYYMIFIKFSNFDDDTEKNLIDFLKNEQSCLSLRIIEGEFDLNFITMQKNAIEFHRFLNNLLNLIGEYVYKKIVHRIINITRINSKLFYKGPTIRNKIHLLEHKNVKLDKLDFKILTILSSNSRAKLVEIATKLKSEKSKILYRIKRMEENGVIASYNMSINLEKIQYFSILGCLSLKNSSFIPGIIEFFDKYSICVNCSEIIGEYDLALEIYIKSPNELRNLIKKFKTQFLNHIIELKVFTTYKEYNFDWFPKK